MEYTVEYRVCGVPSELIHGRAHEFSIEPDAKEFADYAAAQVDHVTARIEGVERTDSGSYEVELSCLANPFQD